MADFIAKLGLDSSAFVAGMEAAAQKTGSVTAGMDQIASGASKAGAELQSAGSKGIRRAERELSERVQLITGRA